MVSDGGDVFIGNSSNKTYHWLIASKRFSNGDKTSWRGVYTWFTEALADDDDLLCYEGMVGGRRALFIDAKQACSRTIELPEGYDTAAFDVSDASGSLQVAAEGERALKITSSGVGGRVLLFGEAQ